MAATGNTGGSFSFAGALKSGGAGGVFGGISTVLNAKIESRVAGLQAAEFRLQKSLLLGNSAVERKFLARQQKTRRGQQAGQFVKGGVSLDDGSALNLLTQQARIDRFNLSRFDFQTALQARNLEIQAQQQDFRKKIAGTKQIMGILQGAVGGGQLAAGGFGG